MCVTAAMITAPLALLLELTLFIMLHTQAIRNLIRLLKLCTYMHLHKNLYSIGSSFSERGNFSPFNFCPHNSALLLLVLLCSS